MRLEDLMFVSKKKKQRLDVTNTIICRMHMVIHDVEIVKYVMKYILYVCNRKYTKQTIKNTKSEFCIVKSAI